MKDGDCKIPSGYFRLKDGDILKECDLCLQFGSTESSSFEKRWNKTGMAGSIIGSSKAVRHTYIRMDVKPAPKDASQPRMVFNPNTGEWSPI